MTDWLTSDAPRLRAVEAFRIPGAGDAPYGLRDRSGFSSAVVSLSAAALHLVTLIDGQRSIHEICAEFERSTSHPLDRSTLTSVLDALDRAMLIEGPTFEHRHQQLTDEFRSVGIRRMPHAAELGIDSRGAVFDAMLRAHPAVVLDGHVVGLIAPHLDYPRGEPCYASAYGAIRGRPAPDRVIVLGTNHFGRSTAIVATSAAWETPLGTVACDAEFLAGMERRTGPLREFELDHVREHSVELQVAWLQSLFGNNFKVLAFLCPDPCGPTGTRPVDGKGVDLADFADALRTALAEADGDSLVVAGADFSHVGEAFGEDPDLEESFLAQVARRDQDALAWLERGDAARFVATVAADDNSTRICSMGCMFVLASAMEGRTAHRLAYHQAVDRETQTCVSCAALAYTMPE